MGVDRISIEKFRENDKNYIKELYRQINGGFFHFSPLKIYLKSRGKAKTPREIQAPTIRDRIVMRVVNNYITKEYFENEFSLLND